MRLPALPPARATTSSANFTVRALPCPIAPRAASVSISRPYPAMSALSAAIGWSARSSAAVPRASTSIRCHRSRNRVISSVPPPSRQISSARTRAPGTSRPLSSAANPTSSIPAPSPMNGVSPRSIPATRRSIAGPARSGKTTDASILWIVRRGWPASGSTVAAPISIVTVTGPRSGDRSIAPSADPASTSIGVPDAVTRRCRPGAVQAALRELHGLPATTTSGPCHCQPPAAGGAPIDGASMRSASLDGKPPSETAPKLTVQPSARRSAAQLSKPWRIETAASHQ